MLDSYSSFKRHNHINLPDTNQNTTDTLPNKHIYMYICVYIYIDSYSYSCAITQSVKDPTIAHCGVN